MSFLMAYHGSVRHSIPASVALFGLLVVPAILVSNGHAQINGAPASVTSPGFGGQPINGPRASVTSVGPSGYAPPSRGAAGEFHNGEFHNGDAHNGDAHNGDAHNGDAHNGEKHRQQRPGNHNRGDNNPSVFYAVPIPVPYATDLNATNDEADPGDDPNDQGGPTVFDRRGSGAASYVPPVKNAIGPHSAPADDASVADSEPDQPQEPIVLIFKDGRKVEVGNYAIQGKTLFDLTTGRVHKIALADLDLEATRKQNEDRGILFQVPPTSQTH